MIAGFSWQIRPWLRKMKMVIVFGAVPPSLSVFGTPKYGPEMPGTLCQATFYSWLVIASGMLVQIDSNYSVSKQNSRSH